jgi:hypothetical protein
MTVILDFEKHQKALEEKKATILNVLIGYYKNLDKTGTVNIPYFLRARDTYNELIKNNKDVNFFYNKIMKQNKIL